MTIAIFFLGAFLALGGQIMLIASAFSSSVLWGLGCFFTPLALVYGWLTWYDNKKYVIAMLIGAILVAGSK